MATRTKPNQAPITVDQAIQELSGAGKVMGLARQATLDYAGVIATAKEARLRIEAARLARKFGRTAPQAQAALERLGVQRGLVAAVRAEQERAAVPMPEANPNGAIAYGRVMREDEPVEGVVVEAQIAGLKPAGAKTRAAAKEVVGRATTDVKGVYQIAVDVAVPTVVSLQVKAAKEDRVLAESGESTLKPGALAYREIVIVEREPAPEEPPPDEGPKEIVMPDLVGLQESSARATLEGLGIKKISVKQQAADGPAGRVLDQSPAAGKQIQSDSNVTLLVSTGNAIVMPDLKGMTADEAAMTLNRLGLTMEPVTGTQAGARVTSQKPAARREVAAGTRVSLKFAKG